MRRIVAFVLVLIVFAPLAPSVAAGGQDAASPVPVLSPALTATLDKGDIGELTVLVHASDAPSAAAAAENAGLHVLDTFERIGVAVAAGAPDAVRAVAADPEVGYVEPNEALELHTTTSHVATGATDVWATTDAQGRPLDGRGITIAIVDSGIDGTHPAFLDAGGASRVVGNHKLMCIETAPAYFPNLLGLGQVPPNLCPADRSQRAPFWLDMTQVNDTDTPSAGGHGTHVAGIAAMSGAHSGGLYSGAAPGSKLVGLSIGQSISIYGAAAGLDWVLAHHRAPCGAGVDASACPPIKVVNGSWGLLGGHVRDPRGAVEQLVDALVGEGITVVIAAGNDGSSANHSSNGYGASPVPGVLMVGNYNDGGTGRRDGTMAPSSSKGTAGAALTYPDLAAPGTSITSACRPWLIVCSEPITISNTSNLDDYGTIGGTSMAAPHIAGYAALLLQLDPTLTPAQIEDVLEDTARPLANPTAPIDDPCNPGTTTSSDQGHGLVDIAAAAERVRAGAAGPGLDVCGGTPPPPDPEPIDNPVAECRGATLPVTDPEGDAVRVLTVPTPLPSEPSHDVVAARFTWDRDLRVLVGAVRFLDLTAEDAAEGYYHRLRFTHAGRSFELVASNTATGRSTFLVDRASGNIVASGLAGGFDPNTNEVTMVAPASAPTGAGVPAFQTTHPLTTLSVLSQRQVGVITPTVDEARGTCSYLLGQELWRDEDPEPLATSLSLGRTDVGRGTQKATVLTAVLSVVGTDAPVASATIRFLVDGVVAGEAVTDDAGVAELVHDGLKKKERAVAEFAGNDHHQASSASA